ncbi:diguanylate cyclase regulator RdcB family protein [Pseudomonas sp. NY15435]|uniref:diguanylate cyclase regulator RdcB family protein n=1 Tax=Pseudomonas sp. NY15435 TaxID=3400358 RepID=UPI003A85C740
MSESGALTLESEVLQLLTSLPEKFVVDFANGIDVARERQRYIAGRTAFFSRMYDGFTGQGARHQSEINASLTDGVEGALEWLKDLSGSLAKSNHAIIQVNTRVSTLKEDVAKIANYSITTRQRLEKLSDELEGRCGALEQQVARIGSLQQAQVHLDAVFSKWAAGRLSSFSLSGRCYAALEELRWGAFGDHLQRLSGHERQKQLELLADRAIVQLSQDANLSLGERIGTRDRWLAQPQGRHVLTDANDALEYLGDWADVERNPFIFAVSQQPEELPLQVPRLGSAQRFTETLISELFLEARHG